MTYSTIEAAARGLLQDLSQFDDDDVTRGDFRVLDRGSPPYAVLYPGPVQIRDYGDWGEKLFVWTMHCEVFERYLDDGSSYTDLETTRQNVVELFNSRPTMGGVSNVIYVGVERGEALKFIYDRDGGGPHFIMQRLVVTVHETANYAGSGEFA